MKEMLRINDLLRYQFLSNVKMSPDGRTCAYVVSTCDEKHNTYLHHLYIWNGTTSQQLTTAGKESMYIWEDADTVLFSSLRDESDKEALENGEEQTVFYRISIHGGEAQKAFTIPLQVSDIQKLKDGIYAVTAMYDIHYSHRYMMEESERKKIIAQKKEQQDYEILDELPFYSNGVGYTNKVRNTLFLYDEAHAAIQQISEELMSVHEVKWDENSEKLYYIGETYAQKRTEKGGIYEYDLQQKTSAAILREGKWMLYTIQPWKDKLLVAASDCKRYGINENAQFYLLQDGELKLFAPYEQALGSSVGSDCRLGGGAFACLHNDVYYFITTMVNDSYVYALDAQGSISPVWQCSGSVDALDVMGDQLLFIGMQDGQLQELYRYDLTKKVCTQLTHHNIWVQEERMLCPLEECSFQQGDMTLYGWVMKPANYVKGTKYPGILDIHGGPKTVYGTVLYHEMQVWANKGYFVFFMNPRGSDGRGNEFADIRGKYGTIDYEDLMKFTDVVLQRYPDIDASRIGVTGGSYGGFMTNWIIGHTQRFRAAASQRSIANWVSFAHTSDIGEAFASDQQAGDTWKNVEKLWQHSPLKYADKVTTPTLFIHSDEDYRCPYSEGLQMYSALIEHGVEARLCMFKGENHELSRSGKPKHRIKRLEEITNWMEQHIK